MVSMDIPQGRVCYNSQYTLNCSTVETMDTCTWMITHPGQYPLTIGAGTEVLLQPCSNATAINLLNIRVNWAGEFLSFSSLPIAIGARRGSKSIAEGAT